MSTERSAAEGHQNLLSQLKSLDNRFWIVNVMEMFERLAYYGVRAVIAIYMVLPVEKGGPQFTHIQKGTIFAWWAGMQSFLPMFTGGFADRYGHKRTIILAILLKIVGYALMAERLDYGGFFVGCMLLAAGTAIFKPGVQGTLAATLKQSNASVGWGIFYQLVNIGGFLGPVIAGVLRILDWKYVFYCCALIVSINFLWLPFYKDPTEEGEIDGDALTERQRLSMAQLSQSLSSALVRGWSFIFLGGTALCGALALPGLIAASAQLEAANQDYWLLNSGSITVSTLALALLCLATGVQSGSPKMRKNAWIPLGLVFLGSLLWWSNDLQAHATTLLGADVAVTPSLSGVSHWINGLACFSFFGSAFAFYGARKAAFDQGRIDPASVLVGSIVGLFQHRVFWFCWVFAGFWLMFNQVFDLLPNVIDDWVDSSGMIGGLGRAFSSPAIPTALALFLGLVFAGVCAAGVLLAMRPDHRDAEAVPNPAYAVVAMALMGALFFPMKLALGEATTAAVFGWAASGAVLTAISIRLCRSYAQPMAILAAVLAAVAGVISIRASLLGSSAELVQMANEGAQIPPEWMININPALIVFTMVFFAYLTSFVRPMTSIIIGMLVATAGSVVAGTATVGVVCMAGILVFSVGEMLSSPKKMEYLATLAKPGQEGLFMGYANIPVAIGWIAGSIYAGAEYEKTGDKVNLARRHLVDVLGQSPEQVAALPKSQVMEHLTRALPDASTLLESQRFLFETYEPQRVWYNVAAVGLFSLVAMIVYDRVIRSIDQKALESASKSPE